MSLYLNKYDTYGANAFFVQNKYNEQNYSQYV